MSENTPEHKSRIWVILVAGGSGVRFGSQKQFASLLERQVLDWSVDTAKSITSNLVIVLPKGADLDDLTSTFHIAAGGETRSESVRAGLAKMASVQKSEPENANPDNPDNIVLVHDAVRPLADKGLFLKTIQSIQNGADAAVPAIPATDTIHSRDGEVVDRSKLMSLQTPQAFRAEVLVEIHKSSPEATDDISLCLDKKFKVEYVDGDSRNLKITEPHDLEVAAALLKTRVTENEGDEKKGGNEENREGGSQQ